MRRLRARLALRHRFTRGQAYTLVLAVIVLGALAPSLGDWHPVAALKALNYSPPPVTTSTTTPASNTTTTSPLQSPTGIPSFAIGPTPTFMVGPPTVPPLAGSAPPPFGSAQPASAPVCKNAKIPAAFEPLLNELVALLGPVIPNQSILTALELATGCSTVSPAVYAVGLLDELGGNISYLWDKAGLDQLKAPHVGAPPIPAALLPLLRELAPAFTSVCSTINSASDVVLLVAPYYPQLISSTSAIVLFQSAVVCADIEG